jgi:hypothetical protein
MDNPTLIVGRTLGHFSPFGGQKTKKFFVAWNCDIDLCTIVAAIGY